MDQIVDDISQVDPDQVAKHLLVDDGGSNVPLLLAIIPLIMFIIFWLCLNVLIPVIQLMTMKSTKEAMHLIKTKHYSELHDDQHYVHMLSQFKLLKDVTTVSAVLTLLCTVIGFFVFDTKLRRKIY